MSCPKKKTGDVARMRHRIVIQSISSRTPDGMGGSTPVWGTFSTVWAEIKPVSASQRKFSDQLEHRVTHKIKIRYLASLSSEMRISYDSRTFHIHSFRNLDERGRFIEIMAEEGGPS